MRAHCRLHTPVPLQSTLLSVNWDNAGDWFGYRGMVLGMLIKAVLRKIEVEYF
ncbi:MAG: hypothetical protein Q4D53_08460 [Leptotrichiaceae bacterium]|nr:hypothetical protein [Leptotrichiaceae bacterium]